MSLNSPIEWELTRENSACWKPATKPLDSTRPGRHTPKNWSFAH